MATPYAYPSNITGIMDLFHYVDYLVSGFLGVAILIIIGMVSFLSTKIYSYEKALGFSSFLILLTAILLRFMDLINNGVLIFCIILFFGAVIALYREREIERG